MLNWGLRLDKFYHIRLTITIVFLSLLVSIFYNISVFAEEPQYSPTTRQSTSELDKTPGREWLETNLDITFEHPTRLTIVAEFEIHEIYLPDPDYGQLAADGIRQKYQTEPKPNPKIELALYSKIDEIFDEILNNTFPGSFRVLDTPRKDINSFYGSPDANPYEPPIIIKHSCKFLGLNDSTYFSNEERAIYKIQSAYDLLVGSMKMGATITQDLKLYANAGHKNIFIFNVTDSESAPLLMTFLTGYPPKPVKKMQFAVNNLNGSNYIRPPKGQLMLSAINQNIQTTEKMNIDFELNMLDFDLVKIDPSKVQINSLILGESVEKLPSNINNIEILSSDGIRLFYNNGIINISDLEKEIDSELIKIENEFSKTFNSTSPVSLGINWSFDSISGLEPLYDLEGTVSILPMGGARPVIGYLYSKTTITPGYFENRRNQKVNAFAIKGLLNAGAKVSKDISIDWRGNAKNTNYNHLYYLRLPDGFKLENLSTIKDPVTSEDKYELTQKLTEKITIVSEKPSLYQHSKADIEVRIDFHKIDIQNFWEYIGSVKIDATGLLHHIKVEPESRFYKALPKSMSMEYYNSDALRLVYSEKLLNFTEIEEDMYAIIKENISNMLEEDLKMLVEFEENMLKFDNDINRMDDKIPIKFVIKASGKTHITEEKLKMGSFITKQIELPLSGIKYWNVTYILVLPEHVEVIGKPWVENNKMTPTVEKNSDGRYEVWVTISGDPNFNEDLEITVKLDIDLTLWFFISKVFEALVLFIILIILVIIIHIFRRRKSNKLKKLMEETDIIVEDTEEPLGLLTTAETKQHWKKPDRSVASKDLRIRELKPEHGAETDYSTRLAKLAPGLVRDKRRGRRSRFKKRRY